MPKKSKFRYRPRDAQTVVRRIRAGNFDEKFKKAIPDAVKGNPKPLADLLLSTGDQLSHEHREALAHLIEWGLKAWGKSGRPPLAAPMSQQEELEKEIISRAQKKLNSLRKKLGKRVPPGTKPKLIALEIAATCEAHEGLPALGQISEQNIYNALKGSSKAKKTDR